VRIVLLLLLLFVPGKTAAVSPWSLSKCTNVLEFVEVLVPSDRRNVLMGHWRLFLNNLLKNNIITRNQYEARKAEILEAKRLVDKLEAKGYKGHSVVSLSNFHCAI